MKQLLPLLAIAATLMSSCNNTTSVDLLVYGGSIHTMDSANTVVEAMAIVDGKVVAIGATDELRAAYQAREALDLKGGHVFPGLTDAHCHLYGLGEQEMIVDLRGTKSPEEVVAMMQSRSEGVEPGDWLRGRGWDQNDWQTKQFPGNEMLDAAFPDRPVFLVRVDGHAAWMNSKALEIAGITNATPDPDGGKIMKKAGKITGVLLDNAIELVRNHIPKPGMAQYKKGFTLAVERCMSYGITGVHDMGLTAQQISALRELIEENNLPFRVTGYISGEDKGWQDALASKTRVFGDDRLVLAGVKLYADGALGSRGALLLAPYSDDPDNRGIPITSEAAITAEAVRAIGAGLQVCVHAIGDSAVRLVLNAYQSALGTTGAADARLRIEHAQVVDPADVPRFMEFGVIPSMQPTHCTSDMYWAEARLGPVRVTSAYVWNSLLKSGCILPFGSDFPVELPDPLAGIYAACTRKDTQGVPSTAADIQGHFTLAAKSIIQPAQYEGGWYSSEKISRLDALRGFTSSAAYASRQETALGSLQPGRYADFIVTKADLETCPAGELLKRPVTATYSDGKRVFTAK